MIDKEHHAYVAGWNCGMLGANMENCNFAIFNSPENMKLWEQGKKDAEAWKERTE